MTFNRKEKRFNILKQSNPLGTKCLHLFNLQFRIQGTKIAQGWCVITRQRLWWNKPNCFLAGRKCICFTIYTCASLTNQGSNSRGLKQERFSAPVGDYSWARMEKQPPLLGASRKPHVWMEVYLSSQSWEVKHWTVWGGMFLILEKEAMICSFLAKHILP